MMKRKFLITLMALALLGMVLAPAPGNATTTYTLTDGNSSVIVDSTNGIYNAAIPINGTWLINGVYNMYQQQWFYGPTTAGQSMISDNNLTLTGSTNPALNYATFTYLNPGVFTATTVYSLIGGAPGSPNSDLSEQMRVNNISGASLTMNLYLYTDLDLGGNPAGDTVQILGPPYHDIHQYGKGLICRTVVTGNAPPSIGEVNTYSNTLTSLNSGMLYTLNNTYGPISPPDATWALEWQNVVIPAGQSYILSVDENISALAVPSTALLLGSGLLGLLGLRRFRKG